MIVVAPTLDRAGPVVGKFGKHVQPVAVRCGVDDQDAPVWPDSPLNVWYHRWYHRWMDKTTVYLPAELKVALRQAAQRRGVSEAEVIRTALAAEVAAERPRPRGGLFRGESISGRVDELLTGFGER